MTAPNQHSEHLAAFREWAHSPYGKPKSEWVITREQAYELFEQLEALELACDHHKLFWQRYERALRDILSGGWEGPNELSRAGWIAKLALQGEYPVEPGSFNESFVSNPASRQEGAS